jgi:magnesium transporter
MLYAQATIGPRVAIGEDDASQRTAEAAVWLDLLEPSATERALVERIVGQELPVRADLEEVESSSRLYVENGVLFMSTPLLTRLDATVERASAGFVLTKDHLVTLRYGMGPLFDALSAHFAMHAETPCSGMETLVRLLEAMVDRAADALERVGNGLDIMSRDMFAVRDRGRIGNNQASRQRLREISRAGDALSGLRDSMLGLSRIAAFVPESAQNWVTPPLAPRFATLRADLASLADYQARLLDKAQFLLDATLGFINIDQNDTFRILTVVSVVAIPPTLLASIWGMNFEHMPELHWEFAYWAALATIVLSAIVPLAWFRRRGWL